VPKPCTPGELAARLRATLKRSGKDPSTEFSLLEVLARHAGETVSKQQLSEEGLGRPLSRFDRSIDVHVSGIRQKFGLLIMDAVWVWPSPAALCWRIRARSVPATAVAAALK
jgi:DNA-binding response OmpR family regulator